MDLRRRWGPAYFIVQGLAVGAWWILLAASEPAQRFFAGDRDPWSRLQSVAIADLLIVGLGSIVTGVAIGRGWPWRETSGWVTVGALAYGTIIALDWTARHDASPVGMGLMAAATALSSAVAMSSRP